MHWLALTIGILLNAFAHVTLKWGQTRGSAEPLLSIGAFKLDLFFALGALLFALSLVFYYAALAKINLNVAYPLLISGGMVLIVLTSYFLFGEKLTTAQWIGLVLLAIAMWLIR